MVEPSSTAEGTAARAEAGRQKLAAQAEASPFLIQIGELYEGPFDLLLDLIRRQNINIYDIPIAAITTQYLAYIAGLRDLDVEVAAEFLVVAATLIQIKSKMMLPADPVLPGEVAVDPREELVQRLLEYETFKQAAAQLRERQQLEEASWSRPQCRALPRKAHQWLCCQNWYPAATSSKARQKQDRAPSLPTARPSPCGRGSPLTMESSSLAAFAR